MDEMGYGSVSSTAAVGGHDGLSAVPPPVRQDSPTDRAGLAWEGATAPSGREDGTDEEGIAAPAATSTAVLHAQRGSSGIRRALRVARRPETGALIGTVAVFIVFAIAGGGKGFLSAAATAGWLNTSAELGIVVIPVAMLLIAGEFDLSVGAVLSATTVTISIMYGHFDVPLPVAVVVAFTVAFVVGLINGLAVVRTGLPSFIVTLATYLALTGLTLTIMRAITGTTILSLDPEGWVDTIFADKIGTLNASVVWWVGLTLLATYVLTRRVFGNWVYATGGDLQAARETGVPTDRVKVTLFVLAALGAALVGTIQALEFKGGGIDQGSSFVFNSIIASVIGGILLGGGYGSTVGAMLGATTYGIVLTGVYYTGWPSDLAQAILGGLLLVAVLANNVFRRLAARD
ncbi:ABC transporter permease [Candidatus Protofrankia californiensis]|uniref:Xylose transport system permease protein XylH n=1 Tax=Candidatus Protofrankia californiensis TaxID=1839754 RepID=A0A1C3NTD4_9ACTN|nr:ABC transporter permease [Candidatus Protofrankia californiensis]